jgi:hypothetical protein
MDPAKFSLRREMDVQEFTMGDSRRRFMAGAVAGATGAALSSRLTLLHLTDTHAQLETHPEYMPGQDPSIHSV